ALLGRLKKNGYDGYVGLEYKPGDGTSADSFAWLPAPLRAAR
ncbi:hydroxypyruvate isomerase, partial [Streptomyces sp. NPDC039016]